MLIYGSVVCYNKEHRKCKFMSEISTEKREKILKRRKIKKIAKYSLLAQLATYALMMLIVGGIGILPFKYFILAFVLLLFVQAPLIFLALIPAVNNDGKKMQAFISSVLAVVMLVACIVIPVYKGKIDKVFTSIPSEGTSNTNVYALVDSGFDNIEQLAGKKVAVVDNIDLDNLNFAIKAVNKEIKGDDIVSVSARNIFDAVDMLYNNQVDAILLNEDYADIVNDNVDYSDFLVRTKNLFSCPIKISLSTSTEAISNITKEPFIIAISGADSWEYSDISAEKKLRSDTNMVVVVNPNTHQVLLVSIPRDAYVGLGGDNNKMDKLTHASVFNKGLGTWVETLNSLLGIKINYYLRLNFSTLIDVVDAIGGLDVDNPYEFKSDYLGTYDYQKHEVTYQPCSFDKGMIHLDGKHALIYVRERKHLPNGDLGRNQHQTIIIKAMIHKVCSVSVITKISDLLKAVEGKFVSNLTMKDIYALAQFQLDEMLDWDIQAYALSGTSKNLHSYMTNTKLSMVELNKDTVVKAQEYIKRIMNDEILKINK